MNTATTGQEKEMWIIDTDPGCDDMMCLMYMLNRSDIDLKLISMVEGNTTMENVLINMRKIAKICNKLDVPIARGGSPIDKWGGHAHHVHMNDGLGELEELMKLKYDEVPIVEGNSPMKMVELINQHPGKINILMIGPLTNLALAFMLDPDIGNLVKSVYTMGGAITSLGNVGTSTEFNYSYDYLSTNVVFANFRKIILLPWEPISKQGITVEDFSVIKEDIKKSTSVTEKRLNDLCFLYTDQMVSKICLHRCDFKMCDLYCAMCIFNKKVVKSCFIGKCEFIIDAPFAPGATMLTKKKVMKTFEEALGEYDKVCKPGLQLIVDDLDRETILEEVQNIFYY